MISEIFRFDTHMHFDLYHDRKDVVDYIEKNQSYTLAMTNLPDLYERYLKEYSGLQYMRIALGFHPELAYKYINQKGKMLGYISSAKYIGEIGLDFSIKDDNNRKIQRDLFNSIINECNLYGGKVLSIHSRKAEYQVLESLVPLKNCKVILHWYSGTLGALNEAVKRGYYFSINQNMVKSEKGKKIISKIPLERVLIESDAPFTNGLRNIYSIHFMDDIYIYLCSIYNINEFELSQILKRNFKNLLS